MYERDILNASHGDHVAFARAMRSAMADGFDTPDMVIDFFETPWKWGREFELWAVLERPGAGELQWEKFVELVLCGEPAIRMFIIDHDDAVVAHQKH